MKKNKEELLKEWENPSYKYTVVKESDNAAETEIIKSGITSKFTLTDVVKDIELFRKRIIELESKKKVEEARMENVKRNYPEVPTMDERLRMGCLIYQTAIESLKPVNQQLEVYKKAIEEESTQVDEIGKQTGMKITVPEPPKEEPK
jgi:hypothetical protein